MYNIQEVNILRPLLFEALEYKVGQLYTATKSKKNSDEICDYVGVLLSLSREYIMMHFHDFRLRKISSYNRSLQPGKSPIAYMQDWTNPNNFRNVFSDEHSICMRDIHTIRNWVGFVFSKILELHCHLENLDYRKEYDERYIYVHGNPVLRPGTITGIRLPRKGGGGGGICSSNGGRSFGSEISSWGGKFLAKRDYTCIRCPEIIYPGQCYHREVIRLSDTLEVLRYHDICPWDPDDGHKHDLEDLIEQPQVASKKVA